MIKSKQFFEADAAPTDDNEFMSDVNELIKAKSTSPTASEAQKDPEATSSTTNASNAAEAQPTTPEATPAPEEDNEFASEFKAGRKSKEASNPNQPQATSTATTPNVSDSQAPTIPTPVSAQDKPTTPEDTYKKISTLDDGNKKKALVDIVKIIRSNSIKWTTEIAQKQKLVEADSENSDENKGLWSKVKKAASDVKSGYNNPSGAADELLQKMSPDKTKKAAGGTLTTNTPPIAKPNEDPKKSTVNAQPNQATPNKSKELDDFIKKSYKTIGKAISKDQKLAEIWKNADDKTKYDIASYNVKNSLTEFIKQKYDTYWPAQNTTPNTSTPSVAQSTPSTVDPQKEEKKKKVIGVLQQDEAGKKMNPKDLETITQGVADGKNGQQIVDTLRSQNNNQYDVTDDIKHIVGKAIGEANPGQPVEDTSQLKESTKNMIKNCFIMTEADENADAMSDSKDAKPEDVVWYMDSKALKDKIKDPKSIAGKIKFNKIKIELVDVNAEGQQDDTTQEEPAKPLKEHLKRMFYEAEDPTQNTNTEAPTEEPTQDNAKPEATKSNEVKPDNKKSSLKLSEGSVMVRYIEGPEKGKEVVAKIKDLELDNSLALDIMQFGYYQADLNGAKAKTGFENQIANALINAKNKKPLDAKGIDPTETEKKKTDQDKEYELALKNEFNKDASPELQEKIRELNTNRLSAASGNNTNQLIRIQKINFDLVQKQKICKDVTNNKPLTKNFVIQSKKATKNFIFVPKNQVTRVNYAKGLNWFKMGGFALYILGGQVLKDFSNKLQNLANHFGELSGTKTTSNI